MTTAPSPIQPVAGRAACQLRLESSLRRWYREAAPADGVFAVASGSAFNKGRLLADNSLAQYMALAGAVSPECRLDSFRSAVTTLNGSWAVAVQWRDGETIAAVDRLRSIPLWYRLLGDGRLLVGNDTAALAGRGATDVLDEKAAVELLLSGYVMGSQTLIEGICQVEPGSILHWRNGALSVTRHYRFLRQGWSEAGPEALTDQLDAVMHEVFARWAESHSGQRVIVPLSGGLDSRLILAMLKLHGHHDLMAVTYGRPDGAESRTSREVAEALGVPWRFLPYQEGDWRPVMSSPRMKRFWRSSGQFTSIPHLQDYLAVHKLREQDGALEAVFFPGIVGDMIAGAWVPDHFVDNDGPIDMEAVCRWLFFRKYSNWDYLPADRALVIGRIHAFFDHVPFESIHNSAAAHDLFEFENRQARYIANSVRSFEWFGFSWRLPLCDNELMDFHLSVPTEMRDMKRLYALWMRDRVFAGKLARLAEIPPMGEGRWVWYDEPRAVRHDVRQNARRAADRAYRRLAPRALKAARMQRRLRSYAPPALRFNEWFAQDDSESRRLTVGDLMRGPDGVLSGLPDCLARRVALYADHPVCLTDCLGLLAAAFLADANRHLRKEPGHAPVGAEDS